MQQRPELRKQLDQHAESLAPSRLYSAWSLTANRRYDHSPYVLSSLSAPTGSQTPVQSCLMLLLTQQPACKFIYHKGAGRRQLQTVLIRVLNCTDQKTAEGNFPLLSGSKDLAFG